MTLALGPQELMLHSDWMVWGYQCLKGMHIIGVSVGAHVVVGDKKEAIVNVVYLSNKL
jgi:hypothetical protein